MYTREQFAKIIDHTLLRAAATKEDIIRFCAEAKQYHFAAVVVFPYWVPLALKQMAGTDVKVCTTVGFPYGCETRSTKVHEARNAIANGAEEIDVVINIGALKSGDLDYVEREVGEVVDATRLSGFTQEARRPLVKLILETPALTKDEKIKACRIAINVGVDFIKTATGTSPNGATEEDIKLIRSIVGPSIGVKAAGGIRTVEQAVNLIDAGANRIGTSAGVILVQTYNPEELLKGI